jgi:hypothetical protein
LIASLQFIPFALKQCGWDGLRHYPVIGVVREQLQISMKIEFFKVRRLKIEGFQSLKFKKLIG